MNTLKITKEYQEYLDKICEEHIKKITKKETTEKAFNYIEQDLINKILKNIEEAQENTTFMTTYTYDEQDNQKYNYSNDLFKDINEEYLQELCYKKGINLKKQINYNKEKKFVVITASLIYNYIPSPTLPKIKKKIPYEM